VVQVDRRAGTVRDAAGVLAKFGVAPASIPDYLALVGDSADGYPGVPGWGAKSAAAVLSRYGHLESIPLDGAEKPRGAFGGQHLARSLRSNWERALLFRDLATLRSDIPLFADVNQLEWRGPTPAADGIAQRIGAAGMVERAEQAASQQH
jgi:5'-3' exonuclease